MMEEAIVVPGLQSSVTAGANYPPYTMRISRRTIDKLGVKLYDKASAVVAELIANSYDADAETVRVRIPLSTLLTAKEQGGQPGDIGYFIEVVDDGHGMTPDEAIAHYLEVGRDRREVGHQGSRSRKKSRPVMGRKGIGKLAPFGICQRIEVLSAGGPSTNDGFLITHFYLEYEKIVADQEEPVPLERGLKDRTFAATKGTTIRLSHFLPKRVPDPETFHRQLATRFIFASSGFKIIVEDTRNPEANPVSEVRAVSIPTLEGTKIELSTRPVRTDDGDELPVSGWLALAQEAYKNEELAGVRIYARDKIVATTRDFEQPAGYTGEFTMRSYLVGEVHAEWLDLDAGDDLIRTDRQGILWDSDYGRALRQWGADLIREIGASSRKPRRQRTSKTFLSKSDIEKKARDRFGDAEVVQVAIDLAGQIGGFAAEDELGDEDYIRELSEVILSVAPHKALIQAFQEFNRQVIGGAIALDKLIDLFGKARVAEMASYSQIAAERVEVIQRLEALVFGDHVNEIEFQRIITEAPWLIEPTWSVISKNQALKTFKDSFVAYWRRRHHEEITLAIGFENKRPDFTLISVGQMLHIVEIKTHDHYLDDKDFERLLRYVLSFRSFFQDNPVLRAEFSKGWRIDLVADGVDLKDPSKKESYGSIEERQEVLRLSWVDFLTRAKTAHEIFLIIRDQARTTVAQTDEG